MLRDKYNTKQKFKFKTMYINHIRELQLLKVQRYVIQSYLNSQLYIFVLFLLVSSLKKIKNKKSAWYNPMFWLRFSTHMGT